MSQITTETQLHFLEILAEHKDFTKKKPRKATTLFKTLNAIYLFTIHNEKRGIQNHFPGMNLLAKIAGCCRKSVWEFVNSSEIVIFCDVKKERFASHTYQLKDWVIQWFRLFYRFGFMKHFLTDWDRWLKTFKKRLKAKIFPWVQEGWSIKRIYEGLLNKFSTKKTLKSYTDNPLKSYTIKSSSYHEANTRDKTKHEPPVFGQEFEKVGGLMASFGFQNGDIMQFLKRNPLTRLKDAFFHYSERVKNGWQVKCKPRALQSIINLCK